MIAEERLRIKKSIEEYRHVKRVKLAKLSKALARAF